MRRTLWQMTDDQVFKLWDQAHSDLTALYGEYTLLITLKQEAQDQIAATKPKSPIHVQAEYDLRQWETRMTRTEQRIAAQRTFCAALDNEYRERNPPFWTRDELEAMKKQWPR